MKAVTKLDISQIAQLSHVSTATVSRVINNADCVTPETRARVLKVIEEYNYVPSSTAQNLSKNSSKAVGVIFPDLENPFFQQILRGVTRVADEKGYEVLIFNTDEQVEKEHRILQTARGRNLAGLIISPVVYSDEKSCEILEFYEEAGIPVVLMDRDVQGREFSKILVDNEQGAYDAVTCLIREGHTKIGFLKGNRDIFPILERERGYHRALQAHGIPVRTEYEMDCDQKCEMAYQKMKTLMTQPEPPTAIFTSNNMMTLGCLRYLTEHNLQIGKDIALIGFDDIEILQMIDYKLSVVTRSEESMGVLAMEMILRRQDKDFRKYECERIPAKLVLRGSEKCRTTGLIQRQPCL